MSRRSSRVWILGGGDPGVEVKSGGNDTGFRVSAGVVPEVGDRDLESGLQVSGSEVSRWSKVGFRFRCTAESLVEVLAF